MDNLTSVKLCPRSNDGMHSDVMGPLRTKYQGNARYVVTFVDDNSHRVSHVVQIACTH